ncbi:MAG: hypothetical protein RL597_638, partial [Pseudomonadota bacterium]
RPTADRGEKASAFGKVGGDRRRLAVAREINQETVRIGQSRDEALGRLAPRRACLRETVDHHDAVWPVSDLFAPQLRLGSDLAQRSAILRMSRANVSESCAPGTTSESLTTKVGTAVMSRSDAQRTSCST